MLIIKERLEHILLKLLRAKHYLCKYKLLIAKNNKSVDLTVTLTYKMLGQEGFMLEYTIQKLAKLAKVSTRTLRYYDEIDLLKPNRINSSGYRIYGHVEVDRLQHILFYRQLGFALGEIKKIMEDPDFDESKALETHYQALLEQKVQLDQLIKTVYLTLQSRQEGTFITNSQKFEGFKSRILEENEQNYGEEIRDKYSEKQVNDSYKKIRGLTAQQYQEWTTLGDQIFIQLENAMATENPKGELAHVLAQMHQRWLSYTWKHYSKEAHMELAKMYLADERFTAYYDDKIKKGATQFLYESIKVYTNNH